MGVPRVLAPAPPSAPPITSPAWARCLVWDHVSQGARRAPRALDQFVKKVLTLGGSEGSETEVGNGPHRRGEVAVSGAAWVGCSLPTLEG